MSAQINQLQEAAVTTEDVNLLDQIVEQSKVCLLYTSDAADE